VCASDTRKRSGGGAWVILLLPADPGRLYGDSPKLARKVRQKWKTLNLASLASSAEPIIESRWDSIYAETLRTCHSARPPRGDDGAADFASYGSELAITVGNSRRRSSEMARDTYLYVSSGLSWKALLALVKVKPPEY
jgi:hypothetical protein